MFPVYEVSSFQGPDYRTSYYCTNGSDICPTSHVHVYLCINNFAVRVVDFITVIKRFTAASILPTLYTYICSSVSLSIHSTYK